MSEELTYPTGGLPVHRAIVLLQPTRPCDWDYLAATAYPLAQESSVICSTSADGGSAQSAHQVDVIGRGWWWGLCVGVVLVGVLGWRRAMETTEMKCKI